MIRNAFLALLLTGAGFASCKKDYSCNCNSNSQNPPAQALKKGVYIFGSFPGSVSFTQDVKNFELVTYQAPYFNVRTEAFYLNQKFHVFTENSALGGTVLFTSTDLKSWSQKLMPTPNPWKGQNAAQSIIQFKGKFVGLWPGEYSFNSNDGLQWTKTAVTPTMQKRIYENYFVRGDSLFMMGGGRIDSASNYTSLTDTWVTKDGVAWTKLQASYSPGCSVEDMVFDPLNGKTYGYGFKSSAGVSLGTIFMVTDNGYDWKEVANTARPWAHINNTRYNNVMFKYQSKVYLLFGTASEGGPFYRDVWSYNGSVWQKETDYIQYFERWYFRQQIVVY